MRNIKFYFILLMFFLISRNVHSQEIMVNRKYLGIEFYKLSDAEKVQLLESANNLIVDEFDDETLYKLPDGRLIYEVEGANNFLFLTVDDFNKYVEYTEKPMQIGDSLQTYTHPIKDKRFIEKRDMYFSFFCGVHKVQLDVTKLEDLQKFDTVLNQLDNTEIKKYRLSIIAIVGEFLVSSCPNAEWKYINIPNPEKERSPAILINNKVLTNPASIFYEEYNQRLMNPAKKIDTYQIVKDLVNNCK